MKNMKTISFKIDLNQKEIEFILSRYHFCDTDFFQLNSLYELLKQDMEAKILYEINAPLEFVTYENHGIILVTLGHRVDDLSSQYSNQGLLLEAYMIDCLGLELLQKAYEKTDQLFHEETKKWIKQYDFLGDRFSLSYMKELFDVLGHNEVTYNEYYMMSPKKSVIFIAELTDKKEEKSCGICSNCKNLTCENRKKKDVTEDSEEKKRKKDNQKQTYNYGYQRIFGSADKSADGSRNE